MYNAHEAYLESRILSADPMELVRLLYQGCLGAVRDARRHLAAGDVAARSKSITKAWEIIAELAGSLDFERAPEFSQKLGSLYGYMQRRLVEANLQQSELPLTEVLGLLATLSEGWMALKQEEQPPIIQESPWAQPIPQEAATAYAAQSWSF